MESFLNRYRNITVLLLVLLAQLVLLAVQVKNDSDVPVVRVWAVTAVTPAARVIEAVRSGCVDFVRNYVTLRRADAENRRLQSQVDSLKIENIFLKNELNTADRAKALQIFQAQAQSRTLAATRIGVGAGANSKVVFVDRGTLMSVQRGMGVITPDGIVGKVIAVYPTASEVMLITDPEFAAGVVSQKNQTRGTIKGLGTPLCKMDYVPIGEKVDVGEWLYTSGDDRIFPRGFPVGVVKSVKDAQPYKEIYMEPAGLQRGIEDMLIVMDGVHQAIPDEPPSSQPVFIASPPPAVDSAPGGASQPAPPPAAGTDADKTRALYKAAGDAQGHVFGEGLPGAKPPDFTKLGEVPSSAPTANPGRGAAPPAQKQDGAARGPAAPAASVPPGRSGGPIPK